MSVQIAPVLAGVLEMIKFSKYRYNYNIFFFLGIKKDKYICLEEYFNILSNFFNNIYLSVTRSHIYKSLNREGIY
jgi:predicted glycosyltransferase